MSVCVAFKTPDGEYYLCSDSGKFYHDGKVSNKQNKILEIYISYRNQLAPFLKCLDKRRKIGVGFAGNDGEEIDKILNEFHLDTISTYKRDLNDILYDLKKRFFNKLNNDDSKKSHYKISFILIGYCLEQKRVRIFQTSLEKNSQLSEAYANSNSSIPYLGNTYCHHYYFFDFKVPELKEIKNTFEKIEDDERCKSKLPIKIGKMANENFKIISHL